jgi:hypothetical protein
MNVSRLRNQLALYAAFATFMIGVALGQSPGTGAITGVITDPAGRVVVNASVQAINEATHVKRLGSTAAGVFRVPLLLPGKYDIVVTVPGFAVKTSRSVQVTVSETTSVNIALTVASVNQSLEISDHVSVAELESSTLGGLVDDTAIQGLPLSTRNYTQILGLSPGVIVSLPLAVSLGNGTQNVASDGGMPTSNNIQFNGIDANNLAEDSSSASESAIPGVALPAPDTIQEFRVQTANFDAAYGRGTGANIDLVGKTGANNFHGSAWEFVRNNIFNANDFFSKRNGQPRADLKQNQFGAAVGGRIIKDRTFFFVAYQRTSQVNGLGGEQNPVFPLLTSNRSAAALGAQFCPAGHLDSSNQPATGYITQAGGTQVACDGSNINPVALAILNAKLPSGQFAVPSPQTALTNSGPGASDQLPLGQSTFASPALFHEDQATINVDQVLTNTNTLAGRFFYSHAPSRLPFSPNGAANVPGWPTQALSRNTMFVLADTHQINPNLVNIARFGYMRFAGNSAVQNPISAQSVGEGTPTGVVNPTSNMPGLYVAGLQLGDAGNPSQSEVTNSFIWQDTVALSKGRHNARFGLEFKRHQVDLDFPIETDGLLQIASFDDFLIGQSAAQNHSPLGLSNVSNSTAGGGIFTRDQRYTDFAGFAQDDIKATSHLTINAGLRYEIFGAPTEINGRLANFDPSLATTGLLPASGSFTGFTIPSNYPGAVPSGVLKTPYAGFWKTPHGDVSPRLGFVWQMTEKPVLVLRGGYGIYFDQHSGNLAEQTVSQLPFSTLNIVGGSPNGPATLQSPFTPLILPNTSYPIFEPRTPSSFPFIEALNPHILDGKTQEYNLNMQYSIGKGYLLEVGYVGTSSSHRPGQYVFDQSLLASPTNPVNGETTNSTQNVSARMPIQGISPGSLLSDSVFIANYNSLQATMTRRLQHGFQLQASYTWSKNLDEVANEGNLNIFELELPNGDNRHLRSTSYGPAGDDRDQRLVVNFTWSTPKFTSTPFLVRQLLTNWTFSGIGVIQSGQALSVYDGNAGSVYGLLTARAEATGSNPSTHGSLYSRVASGYLDPAAFTRAPEVANGTSIADEDFGNSGVGLVRGPGQHNMDLAIERIFPVKKGSSFLFRAEFFNLTNTPQFGNPNTNLGYGNPLLAQTASGSFGKINSEADGPHPRIIQFAAKYRF